MKQSKLHITFLWLIGFLLIATPLLSNDKLNRNLADVQAAEDLRFYFQLIDKQHGNPYQYISRAKFLSAVNETIAALPKEINVKDFEIELAKLNNLIRCGHTTVNLPTDLFKQESQRAQFFPLPIKIIEREFFIDFDQTAIPHGSRIDQINGMPLAESLDQLVKLTVTDGYSQMKPLRELESRFGYYFYLLNGSHQNFELSFTTPSGEKRQMNLAAVAGNTMLANNYFRPLYQSAKRYYHFTHIDAIDSLQTMVLTLNTFQANPDWFYQRISSRYDKESEMFDFDHLILDLRQNEGGDRRILTFLYEFLTGKQLVDPSINSTRSLSISSAELLMGINGNTSSPDLVAQAENYLATHFTEKIDGGFLAKEQNWHETFDAGVHWEGSKFNGNIYVLTSGKTFSAAADFARILGQMPNVLLIGEETGGANIGRTANMLLNYELPNTGTMVQVPAIYEQFINADHLNSQGRGTFPDHFISQSYQDLIDQKDGPFEFTLKLIESKQQQGTN